MLEDINKCIVAFVELVIIAIIIVAKLDMFPCTLDFVIIDNPLELLSLHFEVIALLIAICAFIFKEKVNERLLDISYKFWIVKTISGNISVLSLIIIIVSLFLGSTVSCFIGVLIPQYLFFGFSVLVLAMIYYQMYSITSKKSIKYRWIIKKLVNEEKTLGGKIRIKIFRKEKTKLSKKIMKKWKTNYSDDSERSDKENKKHNSYIEEELLIGYILFCKCQQLDKCNTEIANTYRDIIKTKCEKILDADNRNPEDIIDCLRESVKYYKRDDSIILYTNDNRKPYIIKYDYIKWVETIITKM